MGRFFSDTVESALRDLYYAPAKRELARYKKSFFGGKWVRR